MSRRKNDLWKSSKEKSIEIGDLMKGKLIVIEGTDCSGKETQSKLLLESLKQEGEKAVRLFFPRYDTPTGKIIAGPVLGKPAYGECWFEEGIESDPHVISLYYAADRLYNIKEVKDYLEQGYIVLLDRYISSNMAHQGSKIKDKEERFQMYDWIDKLEYWFLKLPKPDLTLFLHVPYSYSIRLWKERQEAGDIAEMNVEHLKASEQAYVELSELYHWTTIDCISKEENLKSIDEIQKDVSETVKIFLKKR